MRIGIIGTAGRGPALARLDADTYQRMYVDALDRVLALADRDKGPVAFNSRTPEWAWLSNFWLAPVWYEGRRYASVEHAYQVARLTRPADRERVAAAPTAAEAKQLVRTMPARADWFAINEQVMATLLADKFDRHHDLGRRLVATGGRPLVHKAPWDAFWGDGRDGKGRNVMGRQLEVVRRALRQQHDVTAPGVVLVSGGAAWADHLAVSLWLEGVVGGLELYFPAPWRASPPGFVGASRSDAGNVANWYHQSFSARMGRNTLAGLQRAIDSGAVVTVNRGGFKARNAQVAARSEALLAYTFSTTGAPDDGGTAHTWHLATKAERIHVDIASLPGPT